MNNKKGKKLAIVLYIIGAIGLITGTFVEFKNESALITTKNDYNNLFTNSFPKETITIKDLNKVKTEAYKISDYNKKERKKILTDLADYEDYLNLKEKILKQYNGKSIVSTLSTKDINEYKEANKNIKKKYQKSIYTYITDMEEQKKIIDTIKNDISEFFEDSEKTSLKNNITDDQIKSIKNSLKKVSKTNLGEENVNIINDAIKKSEEINTAWIKLNVPYISQNKNNVLNGCEAASMLMALQYKGYLKDTTLRDYAYNMPKSPNNNAEEGFTHDIFSIEPANVPHWIAPNALANYGKTSSGNENIFNTTNWDITQLDHEIDNDNPVIIYVTSKLKEPKNWSEGSPKNLHVMLLVGYNKITNQQLIIDPWTHDDGRTSWIVEKEELEKIYNAVGKKSVLIK